jgi:hypothetical protein
MNSLICGSGFGLYGYLPSISKFSTNVYLDKRYKKIFNLRKELSKFESKIIWYNKINKIILKIDYLVIAKRPKDQLNIVKSILKNKNNIKHFFLEKPISVNPKKTLELINIFDKKKINYSIGFLFEYVNWYKLIKKNLQSKGKNDISIEWNIKNNINSLRSWKYDYKQGGGLLRYYGIHFIKLFSDLNLKKIKKNEFKKNSWIFEGHDNKENFIKLTLRYSKLSNFSYKINKSKVKKLKSPYKYKIDHKLIDPRCFFLKKYINKNLFRYVNNFSNLKNFISLWRKIESKKII